MKRITYTCDKCGKQIEEVMYTLTCYAEEILPFRFEGYAKVAAQNTMQNNIRQTDERHLCKTCKDAITDGVFIV